MIGGAVIGYPEFNLAEFNEDSPLSGQRYILFLNPDTTMMPVADGDGFTIPPSVLFPGSEYLIRLINGSQTIDLRFTTPPSINYDGMGG